MTIQALRKVIKRMHYPLEVMLTCVRWYAAYLLSLRHIEEMMAERGVAALGHNDLRGLDWTRDAQAFVHWRMSRIFLRARARDTLAMLDASPAQTLDTASTQDSVQVQMLGDRIERLQAELKFSQTRIEALSF